MTLQTLNLVLYRKSKCFIILLFQVSSYEGPGEGLGYEDEEDLRRLHDDNLDYDILQDELGR